MVEVFKTNVQEHEQALRLKYLLQEHFPDNKINFDLSDCDKVLRIEGKNFIAGHVIMFVKTQGYACTILD